MYICIDKKIQIKSNIDREIDKETDIYTRYKNQIFNLELLLMYKLTNKEKYI